MRIILICLFQLLLYYPVYAQRVYKTQLGEIQINASTPLEDIDAVNKLVNAIIKSENGAFAAVLLIKDFQFRRGLMQEHFNENYMESETFPKAYFTGKIENFQISGITTTPVDYQASGKLTIHGVTRVTSTVIKLSRTPEGILLTSSFLVRPEEFGIKVPRIVFNKIAEEVTVDLNFKFFEQ